MGLTKWEEAPTVENPSKIKLLVVGDFCFGENYQKRRVEQGKSNILTKKGYEYCLSKLSKLTDQSDFVLANLETPLSTLAKSPLEESGKYKLHNGNPDSTGLSLQKHHIKLVSLANNHTMDYGAAGLKETFNVLKKKNVAYLGAGNDAHDAAKPYVMKSSKGKGGFEVIITGGLPFDEKYQDKFQFYAEGEKTGINLWTTKTASNQIMAIRASHKDAFIIAYPHWLENYRWKSESQTELAQALIDAGADIVIGHGTHMFQEMEVYKGKWIIYSIGNFMFNSPGRYRKKKKAHPYSQAVMMEIEKTGKGYQCSLRLYPIQSDNARTHYQPRLVNQLEMDTIQTKLLRMSPGTPKKLAKIQQDNLGYYIGLTYKSTN
jgi:poly-gamma-glutamate capsule biosynthesis protein CapA/YwtB (metallophosphatase superfamily)